MLEICTIPIDFCLKSPVGKRLVSTVRAITLHYHAQAM